MLDVSLHKSAITDHICATNCEIDWDNTKVIDRDPNLKKRHIRESIHIASTNNFNRDQGNYQLSSTWRPLLDGSTKTARKQLTKGTVCTRNVQH